MDFIRYVNSKDVRQYLYDIDYKLSADQVIFVVLTCPFISVDEKVKSLEEYLQSSDALPLTSITDMSFQETFGLTSHEFIRRYISDVRNMTAFMKADTRGYFYQARIQHEGKLEPEPIECFKSYKACFDAVRNYSKEYSMDPEDRLRIDKLSFDDDEEGNGENYLSDSNYCLFSKNLDLMNIYVYDHNCKTYGVGIEGMYVGIPMPFKKGDIVTLGKDINGVYLGYHPEKMEDYKTGRSMGDILFYGIYALENGFEGGYGNVFCYDLEYADPASLSGADLKLVPLSRFMKGEIEADEFYNAVRLIELQREKEREDEYLQSFSSSLKELGIN